MVKCTYKCTYILTFVVLDVKGNGGGLNKFHGEAYQR